MPIQQKLPPPVLLFSDFAGWDVSKLSDAYSIKNCHGKPSPLVNCDRPNTISIYSLLPARKGSVALSVRTGLTVVKLIPIFFIKRNSTVKVRT